MAACIQFEGASRRRNKDAPRFVALRLLVTERALRLIAKSERLADRVASVHFVKRSGHCRLL